MFELTKDNVIHRLDEMSEQAMAHDPEKTILGWHRDQFINTLQTGSAMIKDTLKIDDPGYSIGKSDIAVYHGLSDVYVDIAQTLEKMGYLQIKKYPGKDSGGSEHYGWTIVRGKIPTSPQKIFKCGQCGAEIKEEYNACPYCTTPIRWDENDKKD